MGNQEKQEKETEQIKETGSLEPVSYTHLRAHET